MITYKQYSFCRKIGLPPIPHVERYFAAIESAGMAGKYPPGAKFGGYVGGYPSYVAYTKPTGIPNTYGGEIIESLPIPGEALRPKGQFLAKRSWKTSVEMGEPEAVTLGEIMDNPAEFNGGRHNLTLGQASRSLMMSSAFVSGLQMLGIVSATVSTVATLIRFIICS